MLGSGVGGLSLSAFKTLHGNKVTILESHFLAKGVPNAFGIRGYKFDAELFPWAEMSWYGVNTLQQILDFLLEQASLDGVDSTRVTCSGPSFGPRVWGPSSYLSTSSSSK
ncbi:unnamed protein product [Choristocarpus tenellus]